MENTGSHTVEFAVNQWLKSGETGYFYLVYEGQTIPAYSNYFQVTNPLLAFKADEDGAKWENVSDTGNYTLEYSADDFNSALQINISGNSVDTFGIPAGTYQWQVKTETLATAPGSTIVSENTPDTP